MNDHHDLAVRVAALERHNTRLRRYVGLAALCAVALPALAAFAPFPHRDELKAERFVLVDAAGEERGAFEFAEGTTPRLVLRDPEGAERLLVGVDPQTAFVLLKDDRKQNRLGLAVDAYPHLMMQDETQRPRIHASVGIHGAASLLFDDGKRFALGLGIDSKGMIWRKPEIDEQMAAGQLDTAPPKRVVVPPPEEEATQGSEGGKKKDG